MEQYLDLLDNKYHITMFVDIPNYTASPRSILNFRVKSVINGKDETIFDPNFKNSNYIFKIKQSLLGKKVFFNFSFDKDDIFNVKSFEFALCDEGVRWIDVSFAGCIKNESYISSISETNTEKVESKEVKVVQDNIEVFDKNIDIVSEYSLDVLKEYDKEPVKVIISTSKEDIISAKNNVKKNKKK